MPTEARATRAARGPLDPRLLRRARPVRRFLVAAVLIGSATAAVIVGQAWLIASTVGAVFAERRIEPVLATLPWLAAVILVRAALNWLNSTVGARAGSEVKSQLRTEIMTARLTAPGTPDLPAGRLSTMITGGLDALDGYFARYLPQLVLAVTVPLIIGVAILRADPLSALIVALTLPLIPLFMILVGWMTSALTRRRFAAQSRLAHHFADLVAGLPTLQVFGRARAQAEGLRRSGELHRRETLRTLRVALLSALVLELLASLSVALVAVGIGLRVVEGDLTLTIGLFVLILAPEAYLPLRLVGAHYHDSADGIAAVEQAFAVIDGPAAAQRGTLAQPDPERSTIEIAGLTVRYPDAPVDAVHDVDLVLGPGELVGLAGPSGSGKSTLLQVLLGFRPPTAGRVLVGGGSLSELDPDRWRSLLAWVPQQPALISGTIGDNVALGSPGAPPARVRAALDRAGGADLDPDRPLPAAGAELSAGELRRVALARALLKIDCGGARWLLLDEPTAGLDPETELAAIAGVRELGVGGLVVSHRPAVLLATDRVVTLTGPSSYGAAASLPEPVEGQARVVDPSEREAVEQTSSVAGGTHPPAGRDAAFPQSPAPITEPDSGTSSAVPAPSCGSRSAALEPRVLSHRWPVAIREPASLTGQPLSVAEPPADFAEPPSTPIASPSSLPEPVEGQARVVDQPARSGPTTPTRSVGQPAEVAEPPSPLAAPTSSFPEPVEGTGRPFDPPRTARADRPDPVPRADRRSGARRPGPSVEEPAMITVDRRRLAGAIALGVLAQGAAVGLLATSAWLLSRAAEHPPVLYLLVAVVSVRALGLGRGVFRYLERLVGHDVALRAQAALRLDSYRALARTTWLGRRGGDLLSRMINDVEAVQDVIVRAIVPIVSAAVVIIGGQLMITVLSPSAGLATLLGVAVAAGLVPVLATRLSARLDREVAALRGALAGAVAEATEAAPDLIAYDRSVALDRIRTADADLRRAESRAALAQGVAAAGQTLGTGAAVLGALVLGSAGVAAGTLPPVQLAVVALTPLALAEVTAAIPAALQVRARTRTALARVRQVIEAPPIGSGDRPDPDPTDETGVRLRQVTAGWPDGPVVATELDLELRPGDRVGLVGPSGSGKTTIAATIMDLIPARAGRVEVSGSVGYLAQDAYLFDTTVAENLRLGRRDATDEELAGVLRRVGLDLELDRLVGLHGTRLSGGEARRLALARVLLGDHPILILDEPTEHLDAPTAERLLDDLCRVTADAAVLIITHDPRVAARCDRLIDLRDRALTPVGP